MGKLDRLQSEQQHRILMCYRMAHVLNMGEVILDLTAHNVRWSIVKDDVTERMFTTLEAMESFLEKEMELKFRGRKGYGNTHPSLRLRHRVIVERERSRMTGEPMTFRSRINQPVGYVKREML